MEDSERLDRSPVGLETYRNPAQCLGKNANSTHDDTIDNHLADSVDGKDADVADAKSEDASLAAQLKDTLNFERYAGIPNGCVVTQDKLNGVVRHTPKDECTKEASDNDAHTDCATVRTEHCSCVCTKDVQYVAYQSEKQMPDIMRLFQKDLSEPYSIYTYRYFIHNWPKLCFLAMDGNECVGAIVCKLDMHKKLVKRGYIAMLAVDAKYRKRKIGSTLVLKAIEAMIEDDADEVVLETEITNKPALRLYENLGFVRDKRLFRYYLNGVDALRLKLWLR
ncbi:N-alpha-acetyltransferase 30-like [Ornithodoros turicata]|uniref:N-alpha-acetyltransferase 30-like n=1 Tax=Ornithodoros turicata TaxID=34597 RepID=UPI003139241B